VVPNPAGAPFNARIIHLKIRDLNNRIDEMIRTVKDTMWIDGMNIVDRVAFEACMVRTVDKFVNEIFANFTGTLDTSIGEILISDTAQKVLVEAENHGKLPLADLIKERVSGNGGFDFHTESSENILVYGEAKYSGVTTRYTDALRQINEFINDGKDSAEIVVLQHLVDGDTSHNAATGLRGYTAAFSMICENPDTIFNNAMASEHFLSLGECTELYLIGVEIDVD